MIIVFRTNPNSQQSYYQLGRGPFIGGATMLGFGFRVFGTTAGPAFVGRNRAVIIW